ncbi:hypothetical protein EB796_011312 [Bugula neritina]|uniref:Nucleoside diphosphate kinase n=1 Tax=Bugula neritina TaxID=10212 RepID=A0A7J7JWZ4_BUGNE|nr:hypothetical protein EB796_011312 [Bugula neritina]
MASKLHLTVAILKPSTVSRPAVVQEIVNLVNYNDLRVITQKQILLTKEEACRFYKEHEGRFFYNRLVTYMCSGPIMVMALAGEDVIQKWRKLMGPTKVYRAQYESPTSIRGLYGISDTRNAAHGSDSVQSAEHEIQFFFPEFDYKQWYRENISGYKDDTSVT